MIDIEKVKERALQAIEDASEGYKRRIEQINAEVGEALKVQGQLLKPPSTQIFGRVEIGNQRATYDREPGEEVLYEANELELRLRYEGPRRIEVIDGGKLKPGKYAVVVSFIPIE